MVDKPKSSTHNRGINVTSDSFVAEENHSQATDNFPSLYDVRNQLINVIDVMGTTSPRAIPSSTSRDADVEDSIVSSTSIFSSVLQVKHKTTNKEHEHNSPRDISNSSTIFDQDTYVGIHDLPQEKPPVTSHLPVQHYLPTRVPPTVLCMNPSCICSHAMGGMGYMPMTVPPSTYYQPEKADKYDKKDGISKIFGRFTKTSKETFEEAPIDLYKMNVMQPESGTLPMRFVFDRIESIPKPEMTTIGTNTKGLNYCSNIATGIAEQIKKKSKHNGHAKGLDTHINHYTGMVVNNNNNIDGMQRLQVPSYYKKLQETSTAFYKNENGTTKVDVYYFDHGNAAYYKTTDSPPIISTEQLAEKTENYATKFWAELFGTIYICAAFITSFILQLFRFVLHSIVRPLTVGVLQLVSDYFFKPLLAVLFNSVIQPPLIFLYNISTSLRDMCDPLAEGMGYYLREIAVLCKSIRIFDYRQEKHINNASSENVCEPKKCECPENVNK